MKQKDGSVSRRDFIKTTGAAAALAGIASAGLLAGARKAEAAPLPEKWDEELDVAVFGTGFAGLAAAIEAHKAGAKTAVFEKMKLLGGNSAINGGVMAAAGSEWQKKAGTKDSPELLLQDMLKAGLHLNHVDLAKIVAEQSAPVADWLVKDLGVEFLDTPIMMGGHSVPRSLVIKGVSGFGVVKKELDKLKELGVPIRKETFLTRLHQDESGRVVGVQVREGYKFPDAESGQIKNIKVKKGVVVATGGFSRDLMLRSMQDPRLDEEVDSTNHPGATGEALCYMLDCGAAPVQLSWIQLGPWASPDEKGFGLAPHFATQAFIHGLLVDPKTGKRIINELGDRKVRADAILKTEHPCVIFAREEVFYNAQGVSLDKIVEKGVAKKFATLEELAAAYEIPVDALKEEVAKYNKFMAAGVDEDFGKPFMPEVKPLEQGPFAACRLWPKVHHTMGGALINKDAQVLDLYSKPIPGLYAAGEVTGGIHGACRLGSVAVSECLIFGRIAGQQAAKA